jgi:hypothetical protein
MPRLRSRQQQLGLEWADTMQWEGVPPDVRERVRELLVELLQHAARREEGAGDE